MYTQQRRTKFLKTSSGFLYAFVGLYALLAAYNFSLDNKVYWLFFAFLVISLVVAILVQGTNCKMQQNLYDKLDNAKFLGYTIASIVSPVSFVLNVLVYLSKPDLQTVPNVVLGNASQIDANNNVNPTRPLNRKKYVILTAIALLAIVLFSFVAQLVNTSGFSVKIYHFTLTQELTQKYNTTPINKNGKDIGGINIIQDPVLKYTVDVYKPKSATKENPAPVVFVIPGFTRTKETQAQYCIELSRRGFVVFCNDPGQQGGTTTPGYDADGNALGSTVGNNGLDYLWQYVFNNTDDFDYIDRDRIGATGHSAGGGDVIKAAAKFAGATYQESFIKAVYSSAYIKNSAANSFKNLRANAALAYPYYDEGSFRYQSPTTSLEAISLRFVNEVFNGQGVSGYDHEQALYEYGYGDMNDGTYRIVRNEKTNHAFAVVDKNSIANALSFFVESLGNGTDAINNSMSTRNQIWQFKEIATGLSLVGAIILIVALSGLLITTPFFGSLRHKELNRIKNQTTADKLIFWLSAIATILISCLDYIPLAYLSTVWFPEAATNTATFVFPARMFNAILLWAVVNGLIGLVLFFGTYFAKDYWWEKFIAKKQGRVPVYDFERLKALKINWKNLLKTLLLSLILFASFFALSQICTIAFGVDFRFVMISSGVINLRFFVTWLMYFPLIFIFYIANSIRVNMGMTFQNWKEWKIMTVGALLNSLGIGLIFVVNYLAFIKTGAVFYGYYGSPPLEVWLYVNMLFPLIIMMFVLPILNRIFYRQTNSVYLGAISTNMIFVMMGLLATVSYIPL